VKHYFALIVSLLIGINSTYAAEKIPPNKHAIFAELGGNALFYSVNYEYRTPLKPVITFAPSVGYTYWGKIILLENIKHSFTARTLFLFGKKNHFFEVGPCFTVLLGKEVVEIPNKGGYPWEVTDKNKTYYNGNFTLGYRYQAKGGFLMRITLCPTVTNISDNITEDKKFHLGWFKFGWSFSEFIISS
jgi:hypothetical protein